VNLVLNFLGVEGSCLPGFCSIIELVFFSVFSGCIFCLIGYSANRLSDKDSFPVGGLPWVFRKVLVVVGSRGHVDMFFKTLRFPR